MNTTASRRLFLRNAGLLSGGALLFRYANVFEQPAHAGMLQVPTAQADPLSMFRAQMGALPIQTTRLGDRLVMLSGPGGNVVVLHGPDGKIVVDSFLTPAWTRLKSTLDGLDGAPVKTLIDTHWHFDHTDNNANFRTAGAAIVAHANTKKRMTESHDVLGMHFDALSEEQRTAVLSAHPRTGFKTGIIEAFAAGIRDKPETAFGTVNADFLEATVPGYVRPNVCDYIRAAPFAS